MSPSPRRGTGKHPASPNAGHNEQQGNASGNVSGKALRETVESIVVAFVLAFLFRAFEAEAFVIPTGSMAPTLMGRHKDVNCPECGYNYRASASQENDDARARMLVQSCMCPSCGYRLSVAEIKFRETVMHEPTYAGDRILVSKFTYEINDPERWDVIVFKYPGNAKMNYIKRLVGLPNEVLQIRAGDIFAAPRQEGNGSDPPQFRIARKPADKLKSMLQTVHDNQYLASRLVGADWPQRWQAWPPESDQRSDGWQSTITSDDRQRSRARQTWVIDGSNADRTQWIRYQHYLPAPAVWQHIQNGSRVRHTIQPIEIKDEYAYNRSKPSTSPGRSHNQLNWVGDLAIECDVEVNSGSGQLELELLEGGRSFRCMIDLNSGLATLSIDGSQQPFDPEPDGPENRQPTARTRLKGPGSYRLMMTNVDDQITLWVNGRIARFEGKTTYPRLSNTSPTEDDLAPVGIGARGAALVVDRIRVLRDVYYVAQHAKSPLRNYGMVDLPGGVVFEMGDDQFFVLGDNSPQSKDSRLWTDPREHHTTTGREFPHYVDRDLLIGKALFIYWPHARSDIFPFCPNIPRMGFVR